MNLSHLAIRNPGTKLLALGIACVSWYVLSGERRERISERSYRIPLSIVNIPTGTMIVSPLPEAVDIRVRGPFTALRRLEPARLEAVIDLLDASAGEKRYALEPADINVPADVEVIALSPSEVRLALDAVTEKTIPIIPEIIGAPVAGSHVEEVVAEPRKARVLGPAKTLARILDVRTEPVSVADREASFSAVTSVASQAPGVRVREGQVVTVRVRIRPAPTPVPTPRPKAGLRKGRT